MSIEVQPTTGNYFLDALLHLEEETQLPLPASSFTSLLRTLNPAPLHQTHTIHPVQDLSTVLIQFLYERVINGLDETPAIQQLQEKCQQLLEAHTQAITTQAKIRKDALALQKILYSFVSLPPSLFSSIPLFSIEVLGENQQKETFPILFPHYLAFEEQIENDIPHIPILPKLDLLHYLAYSQAPETYRIDDLQKMLKILFCCKDCGGISLIKPLEKRCLSLLCSSPSYKPLSLSHLVVSIQKITEKASPEICNYLPLYIRNYLLTQKVGKEIPCFPLFLQAIRNTFSLEQRNSFSTLDFTHIPLHASLIEEAAATFPCIHSLQLTLPEDEKQLTLPESWLSSLCHLCIQAPSLCTASNIHACQHLHSLHISQTQLRYIPDSLLLLPSLVINHQSFRGSTSNWHIETYYQYLSRPKLAIAPSFLSSYIQFLQNHPTYLPPFETLIPLLLYARETSHTTAETALLSHLHAYKHPTLLPMINPTLTLPFFWHMLVLQMPELSQPLAFHFAQNYPLQEPEVMYAFFAKLHQTTTPLERTALQHLYIEGGTWNPNLWPLLENFPSIRILHLINIDSPTHIKVSLPPSWQSSLEEIHLTNSPCISSLEGIDTCTSLRFLDLSGTSCVTVQNPSAYKDFPSTLRAHYLSSLDPIPITTECSLSDPTFLPTDTILAWIFFYHDTKQETPIHALLESLHSSQRMPHYKSPQELAFYCIHFLRKLPSAYAKMHLSSYYSLHFSLWTWSIEEIVSFFSLFSQHLTIHERLSMEKLSFAHAPISTALLEQCAQWFPFIERITLTQKDPPLCLPSHWPIQQVDYLDTPPAHNTDAPPWGSPLSFLKRKPIDS